MTAKDNMHKKIIRISKANLAQIYKFLLNTQGN